MMGRWDYVVSAGDINNGNIRFASCPFAIGSEYVGGTKESEPAAAKLIVTFIPGDTSEQWLYGDKKIFNNRNPRTKNFFAAIGAVKGTKITITQTAHNALRIEKVK